MKNFIKLLLQKSLGFKNYLFVFSIFKILTLKFDKEEGVFLKMLNLLTEDSVVLDIGANIGIMTVLLAKKCTKGKIYSFEPIDENYETLVKIVKFFGLRNVKCYKLALGDKIDTVKMIMPEVNSVKLQGLPHIKGIPEKKEKGKEYTVSQSTLDIFWEKQNEKISAIKIDVENYENYVFKGLTKTLTKYKPLIYAELWDNENREKSFQLLNSLGYIIKVADDNTFLEYQPELHCTDNFFFFPK
jgi:FkbM family methyltransferase